MQFLQYMILPYIRYFDFSGRSSRMEVWAFSVFMVISAIPVAIIDLISFGDLQIIATLHGLASFIPSWALIIRRYHDLGRSAWNALYFGFAPTVGIIIGVIVALNGAPILAMIIIAAMAIMILYSLYLVYFAEGEYGSNDWGPPYGQYDEGEVTRREPRGRPSRSESADPIANRRRLTGRQYNSKPYNS